MQEVTKTRTVSGIIKELDVALTTNNTYELFRIRVINASGHSAQLVANILSPAEASFFLIYNITLLFKCITKAFAYLET